MSRLLCIGLVSLLGSLAACRPPSDPAPSSTASAEAASAPEGSTEAEVQAEGDAQAPIDPDALRAGLDTLCSVTRARLGAVGDFTMQERAAQVRETFRRTDAFPLVDRFLREHVPEGAPLGQYQRIRHAAAVLGYDDFDCPAMEQLIVRAFYASNRSYDGPELTGEQTVTAMCDAARTAEVAAATTDADRRRAWGRAARLQLTGLRANLFLDSLGRVAPTERYARVQAFAEEHGVQGWTCDALRPLLEIPGRYDPLPASDAAAEPPANDEE